MNHTPEFANCWICEGPCMKPELGCVPVRKDRLAALEKLASAVLEYEESKFEDEFTPEGYLSAQKEYYQALEDFRRLNEK